MLGCLLNLPGGSSSQCGCVLDVWPLELKVSMPRRAIVLEEGLHLTGALRSPSPCPRPGGEWLHGALQLPWCSRAASGSDVPASSWQPVRTVSNLPAPPAVLGTSLLRALAVPGYCAEERGPQLSG